MGNMDRSDVIVVGAGPAGAACALLLQEKGLRVTVVDQASFPRDKVCGEFISPAADEILAELGVLSEIEQQAALRLEGVAVSSYGGPELCIPYPNDPKTGRSRTSLSLPRFVFDNLLVKRMQARGVDLREGYKVDDLIFEDGTVRGVCGNNKSGERFELRAALVVDAGGRNSLSIRRLKLKRNRSGPARVALAAHWDGVRVPRPYCYMHVSRPGYTGTAPVGEDSVNVVLVVKARLLQGQDREEFYRRTVLKNPLRRDQLQGGKPVERVRMVDSLAFDVAPVPVSGLMLVGDATGFIDPFTGEGIYLSLRSAQLAAEVAGDSLNSGDQTVEFLKRYDIRRHKEFEKKFLLSRWLQKLIYRPFLCDSMVSALSRRPDLAQSLVGVIGDYLAPEEVVSVAYLRKLLPVFLGSFSLAGGPDLRSPKPASRSPGSE